MQETVLYQDKEGLKVAENKIICLTFLITHPSGIKYLYYLPAQAYHLIAKSFPDAKFYSLSYFEDEERVPFYDMRMSLVPLHKLKELCMELELNDKGERVADIDVHILSRSSGKLIKITRKTLPGK